MLNALTVDVEDWQQSTFDHRLPVTERVINNTQDLLDLLRKNGTNATFFVQGLVAEKFPNLVKSISDAGHEVASHGYSHKLVHSQSEKEFHEDIKKSVNSLENIIGRKILGYRAPDFSINPQTLWALNILVDHGFRYDSSIYPISHPRYGIPNFNRFPHLFYLKNGKSIFEFPLTTIRILGINLPACGGGYLRLYPFTLTKWIIRYLNRMKIPVIMYVHPYEINPKELSELNFAIPLKIKFTQGLFRSLIKTRIDKLLKAFRFVSLAHLQKYICNL